MTEHDPSIDDEFDDGEELELEPVDQDILEHERQRTLRQSRKAEDSIDINDVYREDNTNDPFEISDLKQFRFSIRHLLILTAFVSVTMALTRLTGACNAIVISFSLTIAASWWYVVQQERRQKHELEIRKQKMKVQVAAQRAAEDGDLSVTTPSPVPDEISFDPPPKQSAFRFAFSMKQLMGAFTVAAVVLGLVYQVGGADNAAVLLGSIALLGLAMHAVGFDPPDAIVLSWWILLVLYIFVSIMAAFTAEQVACATPVYESVLELRELTPSVTI